VAFRVGHSNNLKAPAPNEWHRSNSLASKTISLVWINAMFGCCLRWPGAAKSAVALTVDGKTSNTVKALIK
jgi:hypothetical protein